MRKNILVFINEKKTADFFELFAVLGYNNKISFITSNKELVPVLKEKNLAYSLSRFLNLCEINLFILKIFFPFFALAAFFYLTAQKMKTKTDIIILFGLKEKIIFTWPAKMKKIKTVWVESPDLNALNLKGADQALYKYCANKAEIAVYTELIKKHLLAKKIREKNIKIITPGIKLPEFKHQENIFSKIAERETARRAGKNYFTVGTIIDLNKKQNLEIILKSALNCLSIIPQIQVIVIGEGSERKNLTWLAKKMNMDNMVWFVGEQASAKKWLAGFDVFASAFLNLTAENLSTVLRAASAGLPIIIPGNMGLEDFFTHKKNCLIADIYDEESLTEAIIYLYKNKNQRLFLGQKAKETVDSEFSLEKSLISFEKILWTDTK